MLHSGIRLAPSVSDSEINAPMLRSDAKAQQAYFGDTRSEERIRAHYVLEKRLATRLRDEPPVTRSVAYSESYSELFSRLPDHPQKSVPKHHRQRRIHVVLKTLFPFFGHDKAFLEVGCGDAALSCVVAPHVARAYALDVTDALIDHAALPRNLTVLLSTGTEIPLPECSVDVVLSDQLMEHIHPEDARKQVLEVVRVLKPGGIYYCITPNRVTGPHDISVFFDYVATGFHLKEYDSAELVAVFKAAGFRKVNFFLPVGRLRIRIPRLLLRIFERGLWAMPSRARAWVARRRVVGVLAGLNAFAIK